MTMNHALVVGSQIEGLRGVAADTAAIATLLDARDFKVELCTGDKATRAGIIAGYKELIGRCSDRDAAVFYYAGHGFYAPPAGGAAGMQCIAPVDLRAGDENDFHGITAWELSILQAELTRKTKNVTIILDCCHSAQMS